MLGINIYPAGDCAFFIQIEEKIDPVINSRIINISRQIENKVQGIDELVPSYSGLMVYFNPLKINSDTLKKSLRNITDSIHSEEHIPGGRIVTVPALYGGRSGPDIEAVATHNSISIEEVIRIHSSQCYLVYMLGFTPGFPYLGGMDSRIATPRRGDPRLKIPAGSVGIAGKQTGIYPTESPGGWQIIGQTPVRLFDPDTRAEFLLKAGDHIIFKPIVQDEFEEIKDLVYRNKYIQQIKTQE